ncbi:MAG TPA: phage tail protein [Desulfovibrio sp.]|nr:phage tail protein [Desulfovibrio sp.]
MALKEYLGAIVLEVDGKEYEVESVDIDHKSGRKLVKTMNRKGRPSGYAEGVHEWTLKISAPVPKEGGPDWNSIVGAKLTIYPVTPGGKRESYLDCVALDDAHKYSVDNEAKVDVTLAAMDKVVE